MYLNKSHVKASGFQYKGTIDFQHWDRRFNRFHPMGSQKPSGDKLVYEADRNRLTYGWLSWDKATFLHALRDLYCLPQNADIKIVVGYRSNEVDSFEIAANF